MSAWGMWGNVAIYAGTRPGRRELLITTGLAFLIRAVYDLVVGEAAYPGSFLIGMGPFLCLTSAAAMLVCALKGPAGRRATSRRSLVVIGLLGFVGLCRDFYIGFARIMLVNKYDYFLYSFDGSLGLEPGFILGRLVSTVRPLWWILSIVYESLGLWFGLVYVAHAREHRRVSGVFVVQVLIANILIGYMLYFLFPAMGPKYAFPSYPLLPGNVRTATFLANGVPNAMPSMHFGGALLICWLSKPWKWLYRTTIAFVVLTGVATLGLGEHYLVDLIVAVPYALTIWALSADTRGHRVVAAIGAVLVLSWLFYLRTGWYWPGLSWIAAAGTVIVSVMLKLRLPVWLEWRPKESPAAAYSAAFHN